MSYSEIKKSSFAYRILTALAITLLFVFSALLILDNEELQKILPHSPMRSFTILLAYSSAILSSNYFLALRGRNLTDWRTELMIASNYIIFFSAWTLPWLFPVLRQNPAPWYKPWEGRGTMEQNIVFYALLIVLVPLLYFTGVRVWRYFESKFDT